MLSPCPGPAYDAHLVRTVSDKRDRVSGRPRRPATATVRLRLRVGWPRLRATPEDGESRKSQTPDSSMPSSKRPMGRKQAKDKLKKGEPTNYNLIEKFLAEKEKVREDRWQESKVLHERKLSLEARKIENEEKNRLWEQEQKIMFCDLNTLDPSQKTVCDSNEGSNCSRRDGGLQQYLRW